MTAPFSFFPLAVLLAVTRRGSSIECRTCYNLNMACSSSTKNCAPRYDACRSFVIEIRTPTKTHKTYQKECAVSNRCNPGVMFMDVEKEYHESGNSTCCTTNLCNAASLTVPTWNKTLNGLQCPVCFAKRPEKCKKEVMNCRGSENQCFTREAGGKTVTTINSVTTVWYEITQKGCATESFCNITAETGFILSGNELYRAKELKCRAASRKARPPDPEEQQTPSSGTRMALESTRLCLQTFAGLLMTTSFYHGLFWYPPWRFPLDL